MIVGVIHRSGRRIRFLTTLFVCGLGPPLLGFVLLYAVATQAAGLG